VPLTVASPFFRTIDLAARGAELVHPDAPVAHPLDGGRAMVIERSTAATAAALPRGDGATWRRLFDPLVNAADDLAEEILGPVLHVPRHPLPLGLFGLLSLLPAARLARTHFSSDAARAAFAGLAAHSMLDLTRPLTSAFGLVLGIYAHAAGWPMVRGGTSAIATALAAELSALGGEIETGREVTSLRDLPASRVVLLDTSPRAAVRIAGDRLPGRTRRAYETFRYGPGVFKVDWALDGPIPWTAEGPRRAATVHLGGTLPEVARSERIVARGGHPERPFVLLAQYAAWDPTRAPDGKATAWAYCHVPSGSTVDMTDRIEAQVERFAPGFRDRILARATRGPAQVEAHDPNDVGGDINAGIQDLRQLVFRPMPALDPYWTGAPGIYLCSASTPPGGGVHGMAGYRAARSALRRDLR
jgi:phytoene dehydrogenase-like protein